MSGISRLLTVLGFVIACLLDGSSAFACTEQLTLKQAEFQASPWPSSDPPQPPHFTPGPGVTTVSLPDYLGRRLPGYGGMAWYRLRVPRSPRALVCALLIVRADANAVVYVNGEWLGQGGRFVPATGLTWNHPLYFPFPSERLNQASNTIDIGVLAHGGAFHILSDVTLGQRAALQPRYERMRLVRVGAGEASTILGIGIVVLFGALGFALRDANHYLLALAATFHTVNSLNLRVLNTPVDFWTFNIGTNLAIDAMAACLAVLLLRLVDLRRVCVERGLLVLGGIVALAALISPGALFEHWLLGVHCVMAIFGGAVVVLFFARRKLLPTHERHIYLLTAATTWLIAVRDLSHQFGRQVGEHPEDFTHGFPLIGPVLLVGFGAALLARFVRLSARVEHANQELQQEIQEKRVELERSFEKMRAFERDAVLAGERERIMREMHDGIGGHLVTALAMLQRQGARDAIAGALRDALDDMRVVVNSLHRSAVDIPTMLAEMRARLEPRLASQSLRFRWDVRDMPALRLSPEQMLNVLRIVQESITNALKHAGGREILVATGMGVEGEPPHAFIEIADDGRGIDPSAANGVGIPSMRQRAQRIGAALDVASSATGTSIRLRIPTDQRP